jgi:hypothetical protein
MNAQVASRFFQGIAQSAYECNAHRGENRQDLVEFLFDVCANISYYIGDAVGL